MYDIIVWKRAGRLKHPLDMDFGALCLLMVAIERVQVVHTHTSYGKHCGSRYIARQHQFISRYRDLLYVAGLFSVYGLHDFVFFVLLMLAGV